MRKTITFSIAILLAITSFGQNFEGEIVYQNSFTSRMPGLKDEQLTSMMGTRQEYYVKGGNYKSVDNGSLMQWQIYINKENKLYNKMSNSETVLWNDGNENSDSVMGSELNKGVTEILGYKCDELILTCKSGVQKYYFNSKLGVDTKLFVNHKFGNWYDYLKHTNAIPLKMIVDNTQFSIESIATEIKPMKLNDNEFKLPENIKTAKNSN